MNTTFYDENGKFIDRAYKPLGTTTIIGGPFDGYAANIISRPQIGTGKIACQVMHPIYKGRGHIVITTDGSHAV